MCGQKKVMAKRHKNQNEQLADQREQALSAHMWRLECFSVDDYFSWCASRGFRADKNKSLLNMRRELACHQKQNAVECLQQSRVSRNPIDVIGELCDEAIELDDVKSVQLHQVCHRIALASLSKHERRSLHEFLSTIWSVSKLPMQSEIQNGQQLNYIDALIAIHRRRRRWIRPIDRWQPRTHNREKQFLSLVRHLLITYDVPKFFGSVWFRTDTSATKYQKWYVDVGNGRNPGLGSAPVPLTKKVAHHFLQAPDGYSIEQAIRFGQIKASGGGVRLCNAVIESRLGTDFSNDEFWQSVIRFFISNPDLDLTQVGPIVDFIQHHKFERQEVILEDGETRWLPPPQPNLSMQKRTLRALLTQVDEWHCRLGKVKADAGVRWASSGIRPASYMRGKDDKRVIWRINELLSQKELVREGSALRHCVATYGRQCRGGHSSIWSMTSEDAVGNVRRRQTVELNRQNKIVQCRGRMNKNPNEQEWQIIRLWAKAESLAL